MKFTKPWWLSIYSGTGMLFHNLVRSEYIWSVSNWELIRKGPRNTKSVWPLRETMVMSLPRIIKKKPLKVGSSFNEDMYCHFEYQPLYVFTENSSIHLKAWRRGLCLIPYSPKFFRWPYTVSVIIRYHRNGPITKPYNVEVPFQLTAFLNLG